MNGKMLFSDTFNLTAGDFDQYLRIKPYAVFNLFQDVASRHAVMLHAGYDDLKMQNKAWILIRNKYVIIKEPTESQKVIVQTWPLPGQKIEYNREFRILDIDNNILIKGTSKWSIIDLTTKKLTRNGFVFNGEFFLENNFNENLERIPNIDIDSKNLVYRHQVMHSDLDLYQHMNNAKYSELIYNALELNANDKIAEVQINFVNEAKLKDLIDIYKTKLPNGYYIIGSKDNQITFRAFVKIKNQ